MRLTEDAVVLLQLVGLHLRLLPDAFWLTHHPAAVEGHWLGQAANPRPPSRLREGSTLAAQGVGPGSSRSIVVLKRAVAEHKPCVFTEQGHCASEVLFC